MAAAKSNPLALVCGDDDFAVKQRAKQIFTQWSAELGGMDGDQPGTLARPGGWYRIPLAFAKVIARDARR